MNFEVKNFKKGKRLKRFRKSVKFVKKKKKILTSPAKSYFVK